MWAIPIFHVIFVLFPQVFHIICDILWFSLLFFSNKCKMVNSCLHVYCWCLLMDDASLVRFLSSGSSASDCRHGLTRPCTFPCTCTESWSHKLAKSQQVQSQFILFIIVSMATHEFVNDGNALSHKCTNCSLQRQVRNLIFRSVKMNHYNRDASLWKHHVQVFFRPVDVLKASLIPDKDISALGNKTSAGDLWSHHVS